MCRRRMQALLGLLLGISGCGCGRLRWLRGGCLLLSPGHESLEFRLHLLVRQVRLTVIGCRQTINTNQYYRWGCIVLFLRFTSPVCRMYSFEWRWPCSCLPTPQLLLRTPKSTMEGLEAYMATGDLSASDFDRKAMFYPGPTPGVHWD